VSWTVADIIIAETGADMTAFPTAAHLCSWAGVSPGEVRVGCFELVGALPRPGVIWNCRAGL
jgi:transposase